MIDKILTTLNPYSQIEFGNKINYCFIKKGSLKTSFTV